jgi:hypothetical protein
MRIYKIALIGALALAGIPAGALAAKPSHPTTLASTNANTGKSVAAKVQFVVRGTLSSYTAANGPSNGMVTLTVKSANFDSKALKAGPPLVFVVTSSTKVALHNGAAIAKGDNGIVKFRAAKNNSTWTGLTAGQVIDQGALSNT